MKRILKGLLRLIEIFIIVYVIMICTCLLCYNKYGYIEVLGDTFVTSGDGLEEYSDGDLVVFTRKAYKKIELNDTVYYYDTVDGKYVIKKGKVIETHGHEGDLSYRFTEGEEFVPKKDIVGVYKCSIPFLGKVKNFLDSKKGYIIFVFLPLFIVLCYEIWDLIITIKKDNQEEERIEKQEDIEVLTI